MMMLLSGFANLVVYIYIYIQNIISCLLAVPGINMHQCFLDFLAGVSFRVRNLARSAGAGHM